MIIFEREHNPTLILWEAYKDGRLAENYHLHDMAQNITRVIAVLRVNKAYRVDEYCMGDTGDGMHTHRLFFKGDVVAYGFSDDGMWALAFDHYLRLATKDMQI